MKQILAFSLVLAVAAAGSVSAQPFLSGEATPNPATPGAQVSISITGSTVIQLLSACPIAVNQGSPAGPDVQGPIGCTLQIVYVGPGMPPHTAGWSVAPGQAPGDYFIKIGGFDNVTQAYLEGFFPVRVDAPGSVLPVLSKTTGPVINGSTVGLSIASPGTPNATYVLAASLTNNVGQTLSATQHLALDNDVLYNLSIPGPNPLFTNQLGNLDGAGDANAAMFVPASPLILGWPISFQGAVLLTVPLPGVVDSFALTTPLSHIIN